MATSVEIPALGESVTEAVLSQWLKNEGDRVAVDEPLCELESDKATVDLPSPASGVLHQVKKAGETLHVGEVIAEIEPAGPGEEREPREPEKEEPAAAAKEQKQSDVFETAPNPETARKAEAPAKEKEEQPAQWAENTADEKQPAGNRLEAQVSLAQPDERRVPMSKIRRRIAERLVRAQHTAAMLTTYNEIDMSEVQTVRSRHQDQFQKAHGVPLGLMSFFARASVLALKQFPELNAEIDSETIVYHEHVHLGIAVSTERGLVVPVLRAAEKMSFPRIETEIKRAAAAAREGKLSIEELSGGTFTITNGGVFGSLLSMPILNPPQSGILGMHAIQDRPVAVKGNVEIRPMMYVALTYDHRLVDGKEAVSFLVRIKELLEDPMQMVLEI